jgi:hypothetical protein
VGQISLERKPFRQNLRPYKKKSELKRILQSLKNFNSSMKRREEA